MCILRYFPRKLPTASSTAQLLRSEEHTSELQSQSNLVCRLLLEKKKHNPAERREHTQFGVPLRSRRILCARNGGTGVDADVSSSLRHEHTLSPLATPRLVACAS